MLVITGTLIAQNWQFVLRCSRDSLAPARRDIKETEKRAKSSVQVMSAGITMSARPELQYFIYGARKYLIFNKFSFNYIL